MALGPMQPVDPRLSDASLTSLINSLKKLQVSAGDMPLRPGWGTVGKPTNLLANFFALKFPAGFTIYDYEVTVTPDDLRGPGKARIFELLESSPECAPHMGHVAHDRTKRLVSTTMLPQPLRVSIEFVEEGRPVPADGAPVYKVSITFLRALSLADATPCVVLETRRLHLD